ncbi:large proline-rich protein BAG6 isoform X2 [Drosophila busckii]|uniref:large proline-rich protein BAG6 isoform X2 n=1 Tax=Drosophila busckii TaxID=30019 RepID=UPI00083EA1FB|nr:large proline-rich protein BAG6 isoform X2 [Drosophila busckii]
MLINLKVKTLDARTHEFSIDNEITIRQFKDQIAEKTNIAAENQRIIYQGRVLVDDKQVKEYDVDGKVLHVAERPPFSQRGANATNNDEPMRSGPGFRSLGRGGAPRNMRNAPYFRALDGMLVGTMAIPVANGGITGDGSRPGVPGRFPNSSSFCINRITVALHMIDCANNIAAYLENPAVGLNNQSLDILQRGRWTMESTVVEVGVSSSEMPRNNNIIDMVQDAVTAALSRNTPGRNYTVVQLPTVYTSEGGAEGQAAAAGEGSSTEATAAANADAAAAGNSNEETTTAAAAVIIEDVIETDDEGATDAPSSTPPAAPAASGDANGADAAANDDQAGGSNGAPRRRTRPQVLANVMQRYRAVQTRLEPFVNRYNEILEQDPAFEPEDTEAVEQAQRTFDRVSEAFHYLSHAQHAISDLMLDLSEPGPRVLTCRPILVEQSGYIRSNNIFAAPNLPGPLSELLGQAPPANAMPRPTPAPGAIGQPVQPVHPPQMIQMPIVALAQGADEMFNQNQSGSDNVDDPVDEPMVAPPPAAAGAAGQSPRNPDMDPNVQMARLIQAVVNSATNDNDLHVEFNAPNIMSINLPVHVMTAAVHPQGQGHDHGHAHGPAAQPQAAPAASSESGAAATAEVPATASATAAPTRGPASTSSGTTRRGEQRANTLPTTATQTRSTSRPQIQIGNNNRWASGIAPTHTAFDRFLPCNSHHIREPEPALPQSNNNNNNLSSRRGATTTSSQPATVNTHPQSIPLRSGQSVPNLSRPRLRARRRARPIDNVGTAAALPLVGAHQTLRALLTRLFNAIDNFLQRTPPAAVNTATAAAAIAAASAASAAAAEVGHQHMPVADAFTRLAAAGARAAASSAQSAANAANAAARSAGNAAAAAAAAAAVVPAAASSNAGNILRQQLRSFLHHSVFEGAPINEETMPTALRRALNWFEDSLLYLPQYERPEYNSHDSVCNTLRQSLRLVIELCNGNADGSGAQFEQRLKQICEQFRKRLYSVLFLCLGSANAELYWRQLMRLLIVPMRSNFRNEALKFLCIYIDPTIPASTDTADAQQFLVLRTAQTAVNNAAATATAPFVAPPPLAFPTQQISVVEQQQQPLENDVEMAEAETETAAEVATPSSSGANEVDSPDAMPAVNFGSEPWHNSFPNEWLPVITRDMETQSENLLQPPYSDAYISGMSAKRRKIIQNDKPASNVECLIASGVQRAIQNSGLAGNSNGGGPQSLPPPLVNPEAVIGTIAHDAAVQAAYTEAVRANARERLKQDVNYEASKYPQIAKFTEQK